MKQLICICGWKSELYPDHSLFAGPGGQLSCPECSKARRNRNIEVYGFVKIISVLPIEGWYYNWPNEKSPRKVRYIHYYINGKALCGKYVYNGTDFLHPLIIKSGHFNWKKCKVCESKLSKRKSQTEELNDEE